MRKISAFEVKMYSPLAVVLGMGALLAPPAHAQALPPPPGVSSPAQMQQILDNDQTADDNAVAADNAAWQRVNDDEDTMLSCLDTSICDAATDDLPPAFSAAQQADQDRSAADQQLADDWDTYYAYF